MKGEVWCGCYGGLGAAVVEGWWWSAANTQVVWGFCRNNHRRHRLRWVFSFCWLDYLSLVVGAGAGGWWGAKGSIFVSVGFVYRYILFVLIIFVGFVLWFVYSGARWCPVVPTGAGGAPLCRLKLFFADIWYWRSFLAVMMQKKNVDFDDDGAARTAEGRFFEPATPLLQPFDYRIIWAKPRFFFEIHFVLMLLVFYFPP